MSAKSTKKRVRKKRASSEPSAASLRAMPPLEPEKNLHFGRGPEALKRALAWSRTKRGRPKKGVVAKGTQVKSVRMSEDMWAVAARLAKERGMSVNELMRAALAKLATEAA